ncbi:MAG: hypothetical protein VB084_13575 [Syntrophomonadaceae bacterium]|nr:hypothetical protein [Syntrophomonadaceae bacterium]
MAKVDKIIDKIWDEFAIAFRLLSRPATVDRANEIYNELKRIKDEEPENFEKLQAIARI